MAYTDPARRFAKDLPGADIVFQPPDLADYASDAWDIRISIGDAPLEEAYYFTVDDPSAVRLTIEKLLDTYALNPELKASLDVEEYPDLPFLQEELIQYRTNERQRLMKLEYYINHNPSSGPVNVGRSARDLLSVCTYHDGSHDYRVLDLVIVPAIPDVDEYELDRMRRLHGETFLLMLLDYTIEGGDEAVVAFLVGEPVAAYLSQWPDMTYRKFVDGMKAIETAGLIEKRSTTDDQGDEATTIELTDAGLEKLEALKVQFSTDAEYYDQFDSVSIAPPALGVPGGFDVRVQMMECDQIDCESTLLLQILGQDRDQWFAPEVWHDVYESFSVFQMVGEALAYKTNFSAELMEALKGLASDAT